MFGHGTSAMKLREDASRAKECIVVTRKEFIRLMIANGTTPANAEFHANLAEALNSRVLIGGKTVSIRAKNKTKKKKPK